MRPLPLFFLVTALLVVPARAAGPNPDALMMAMLLGDSAESLFAAGEYTPEAERKAVLDLYADLKAKAEAPGDIDESALARFAVMGWLADSRRDDEIAAAFAKDISALVGKNADNVFGAIAQTPVLVPSTCAALARTFADDAAGRAARESFFLGFESSARQMLGPVDAARCVLAFFGYAS